MNIFDKNITANRNQNFFYQIGRTTTTNIWNRPSFSTTKNLLLSIKNNSTIFERYNVYLMGGITWNFSDTWDIDIVLCSDNYTVNELEDDIDFINNKALNEFQLLTDVQWRQAPMSNLSYVTLQNNENKTYQYDTVKLGYCKKEMNGIVDTIDLTNLTVNSSGREIVRLSDYLLLYKEGLHLHKERVVEKIKNTVNQEARFNFSAEEFINNDEQYFNSIKNNYS